ncbi:Ryncolin-1 [Bulinus truncatus]|nr:Ryncolin-1 [Bulinus truncatus]
MEISLQSVTFPFLALLAALMLVQCSTDDKEVESESKCSTPKNIECRRGLKSKQQYVYVNSKKYDARFLCDTKTDNGGWIVIQRRFYKTTSFKQNWAAYREGFGPICGDYWLGNEKIFQITHSGNFELRIDMVFDSKNYFTHYKDFFIDSEDHNYTLHVSPFSDGNLRDDFANHNGMQFSTLDRDNDVSNVRHCSRGYQSGW